MIINLIEDQRVVFPIREDTTMLVPWYHEGCMYTIAHRGSQHCGGCETGTIEVPSMEKHIDILKQENICDVEKVTKELLERVEK